MGSALVILSSFNILSWIVCWMFVFAVVISCGFLFARPGKTYNFTLVLFIFTALALIPARPVQRMLTIGSTWDPFGTNPFNPDNYARDEPTRFEQTVEDTEEQYDEYNTGDLYDSLQDLDENPFEDLEGYMLNINNVLNWILFIAIIGYGASATVDGIKLDWGAVAKKGAAIAFAILITTIVYTILEIANSDVVTVWDTVGAAWGNMLKKIGFAQLDQSGNTIANTYTVTWGTYKLIPAIVPIACLGLSLSLRKSDFNSIMFVHEITKEDAILVRRTNFSIPILIILIVLIIYVVGYNLVTAEPSVTINPIITLTFYISAAIILFLIGNRILIINKSLNFSGLIKNLVLLTVFGIMGLFLWFQVFQPAMFSMGLIDQPSGLITMSQETALQNNAPEQLFLVAMPETLIFQIAPIGIANRVYYALRKGKLKEKELERISAKMLKLSEQKNAIPIKLINNQKQLLLNLAKIALIEKEIENLNLKIKFNDVDKVSFSYFVLPSMLAALAGSFFFSWYHSFRRGIDFITWWQNPYLGMTYFGAGFFLSLIAFFSAPAAIAVHWLNNLFALILSGG